MSRSAAYAVILASAWILGVTWALSSPVGSSPDDDYHLPSIYCSTGDESLCRDLDGDGPEKAVEVPAELRSDSCFKFQGDVSGECTEEIDEETTTLDRYNHLGSYPPTYYSFMSLFATADVEASVLLMRIVTLSVSLGVFALAAFVSPILRDSQAIAWSICSIPLGMFLFASTNPSAWAVVGVAAMLPSAYAMFSAPSRGRLAVAIAACTLAAILTTSRADAPGMAAGVLGIVTIAYARRRDQMVAVAAAAVLILFLGSVFLGVGGEQTSGNESGVYGGAFWSNLLALPGLLVGVFGVNYGLGWLDTPMPSLVWVPVIGMVAALSVIGLRLVRLPRGIVLAGVAFALTAYPLISLHLTGVEEGFWLQPRYLLPLIFPFVGIALAPLEDSRWDLSRSQRWIVTASAIIATSIAVHVQLRRYTTGNDVSDFNLNADVEWTYLQNVSPMALWVVATLAAAALFYTVFALVKAAPRSDASSTAEVVS